MAKIQFILSSPNSNIIPPHGGKIIENEKVELSEYELNSLPVIEVDERIVSDIILLSNGTYSPVNKFMNNDEIKMVLNNNLVNDDIVWTMPILFQIDNKKCKELPSKGHILLKNKNGPNIIFKILKQNEFFKYWNSQFSLIQGNLILADTRFVQI